MKPSRRVLLNLDAPHAAAIARALSSAGCEVVPGLPLGPVHRAHEPLVIPSMELPVPEATRFHGAPRPGRRVRASGRGR